ncbi:hypothetical protein Cgig2_026030 [Carnegiea gigantea]|uniref:4Fe-4S ferredoxin-type domain-containing protein n=1 Tax=Carnegiea gigantea TaxID=171969 RepID=A0A9Q1KLN9_9CARY|nr:hypothetical protein Cgig2_026030 [Carnegiea gigantea]
MAMALRLSCCSSLPLQNQESLQRGNWVKLICGASFEDVVDIRNLSLVYTLAGVDCIDCAADASVVTAVNEGIEAAMNIVSIRRPWVMISVNDDEDLHFRKAVHILLCGASVHNHTCYGVLTKDASCHHGGILTNGSGNPAMRGIPEAFRGTMETHFVVCLSLIYEKGLAFDPVDCPMDCSRPCETVCPANAILLKGGNSLELSKINGRLTISEAVTYLRDTATTAQLVQRDDVDAIEIHTSGRRTAAFEKVWHGLKDSISYLKLVALDGRPMSGDIGRGSTREALAFAVRLAAAEDRPPGFLQLAGGTNAHTVTGLKERGLFLTTRIPEGGVLSRKTSGPQNALISGMAYGGYARKIVGKILRSMQSQDGPAFIEDYPEYLREALREALILVGPVKSYDTF